jgi:hypothetical protein
MNTSPFTNLPTGMQDTVMTAVKACWNTKYSTEDNIMVVLHSLTSEECVEYYLNWNGFIGYTSTMISLVLSAYGVEDKVLQS